MIDIWRPVFTHILILADGSRHPITAEGLTASGMRPSNARAIYPIRQPDGSFPSLTTRGAA